MCHAFNLIYLFHFYYNSLIQIKIMKTFQVHSALRLAKMFGQSGRIFIAAICFAGSLQAQLTTPLQGYDVSTFAGSITKTSGSNNGTATAAKFKFPNAITMDTKNNLYVCDTDNNLIRKVSSAAVVTTLAGTSTAGTRDGAGATAQFDSPRGIAVDKSGNVYVADANNHTIRKITPQGNVSTLAGKATVAGSVNGSGTTARFNLPSGITIDAAGNLYVADGGNNMIRKVTPQGVVSTLAGATAAGSANGLGSYAKFNRPSGITIDAAGNLYVADAGNNMIRKVSPQGNVTLLAGDNAPGFVDAVASLSRFDNPIGISADNSGNLYVGDEHNHVIRKISASGIVSTIAGQGPNNPGFKDGHGTVAKFENPRGLVPKSDGSTIFVVDNANHCIRRLNSVSLNPNVTIKP